MTYHSNLMYRAKYDTTVRLMSGSYFLIRDWEVVAVKMEHNGLVYGELDGIEFFVEDYLFFRDFSKIPERIERMV